MKQLDELESTNALRTPGMLGKRRAMYKAFASPVLVVPSFTKGSWVLGRQLSLQELGGLPSHFLTALGTKGEG